jgi:hypothetical protein
MRDPVLEAALAKSREQVDTRTVEPIEIRLKGCDIALVKELEPTSGRWFVSLNMTRGDTRWVLMVDDFNAERIGNALVAAAAVKPDAMLAEAASQNGEGKV